MTFNQFNLQKIRIINKNFKCFRTIQESLCKIILKPQLTLKEIKKIINKFLNSNITLLSWNFNKITKMKSNKKNLMKILVFLNKI